MLIGVINPRGPDNAPNLIAFVASSCSANSTSSAVFAFSYAIADRRDAGDGALAWMTRGVPIILPMPGSSSVAHFRESLAVAERGLPVALLAELDGPETPAPDGRRAHSGRRRSTMPP